MAATRFLLLICVVVWGWTFVATKVCLGYLDPIELVGLRFLIGLPIVYVVIRFNRVPIEFSRQEMRSLAVGGTIIAVHFVIQAIALNFTSATNTGWIIAVTPLAIALFSFLFLNEKLGRHEIMGIVVATAGILFLVSRGDFTHIGWLKSTGDWLVLASAHTWALYTIATRDLSRSRNPLVVTLFVFLPVMVLCLLYSLLDTGFSQLPLMPIDGWIGLLFLGVLGTLTQWFWQIGVAKIGATKAGVFLFLEPVATTALAVPLLGEYFGSFTAVGAALVTLGVWLAQKKSRKQSPNGSTRGRERKH